MLQLKIPPPIYALLTALVMWLSSQYIPVAQLILAIYLGNLTAFLVLPAFYFVITEMQIKPEEQMLEQKFGEEYLDYKSKVRRWL